MQVLSSLAGQWLQLTEEVKVLKLSLAQAKEERAQKEELAGQWLQLTEEVKVLKLSVDQAKEEGAQKEEMAQTVNHTH